MTHTQLPWRYEAWSSKEGQIVATTDKQSKALVAASVMRADAELILRAVNRAPAPDPRDALMAELAEALRQIANIDADTENMGWFHEIATAALAKYEGANK